MEIAQGLIFLGVELVLIALVLLAMMRIGFARLESSIGIMSDGIPVGKAVPSWSLPDLQGVFQRTPTHATWQFLIFADYSLGAFPLVIVGMHMLSSEENLQVLLLSRGSREVCAATAHGLNLQIPVVPVENTLYDQFRLRVMPFGFLIDPTGVVHWAGLVNSDVQMRHIWHLVQEVEREIEFVKG